MSNEKYQLQELERAEARAFKATLKKVENMVNETLGKEIQCWHCPIHNRELTVIPLPDDYNGPKAHLKIYFCEDCKKGYSVLDLLDSLTCKR